MLPTSEVNPGTLHPNHLSHLPSDLHHVQIAASWELRKYSWAFAATSDGLVKIGTQYLIITSLLRTGQLDVEREVWGEATVGEYRIRALLPLLPAGRSRYPMDEALILGYFVQI